MRNRYIKTKSKYFGGIGAAAAAAGALGIFFLSWTMLSASWFSNCCGVDFLHFFYRATGTYQYKFFHTFDETTTR